VPSRAKLSPQAFWKWKGEGPRPPVDILPKDPALALGLDLKKLFELLEPRAKP
jgi:hypothetical protein